MPHHPCRYLTLSTHKRQRVVAEGAREHYNPVWISGANPGDVLYLLTGCSLWRLKMWKQAPHAGQAEVRLPDVLPERLPRENVVFIPHVLLQAILVLDSPDVDIVLWNATVAEMETSGKFRDGCALRALR